MFGLNLELATWLPCGWRMESVVPIGFTWPHLEAWFHHAIESVEIQSRETYPGLPPGDIPGIPSARSWVAHAFIIIRHLGLPDPPIEPRTPIDRPGCAAELRDTLEFLRRAMAPAPGTPPAGESGAKGKRPGSKHKWIDEKMMKKLLADPESVGWSARAWAEHLECSPSTIHETTAWKSVMCARALRKAEAVTRQKGRRGRSRKS
jgi:hypothetical protein